MQDLGKLLLRLMIGGFLIFYGVHKLQGGFEESVAWIGTALEGKGLPDFLKYGVYVGELVAPALLILGFLTRIAGLVVAGNMGFAIFLSHMEHWDKLTEHGGWMQEHPLMFLIGGLCIALLGPGRFAVLGPKQTPEA